MTTIQVGTRWDSTNGGDRATVLEVEDGDVTYQTGGRRPVSYVVRQALFLATHSPVQTAHEQAYEVFRKAHPATRCFQKYASETRASHAASRRLGHRQREAVGQYFYTHPMTGNIAFPTAKAATERAYELFCLRETCAWLEAA